MKLRILIIAESANPEWVSVPLVGWSLANAISKVASTHVVTQIRNRDAFIRAGQQEGTEFTAIDSEAIAAGVWKIATTLSGGKGKSWTTITALSSISYYYFEHLIWKQFAERIRSKEFDVVHRVTPLSPTTPSLLSRKCRKAGVPFILGPLNGGVPWPKGFEDARHKEREWLSYLRVAYKLLPGYRSTRKSASAILIGSRDSYQQMPKKYHDKCLYLAENAIDPSRFTRTRTTKSSVPLRAIFVGRLVPYKGADMLIEAAAPLVKCGLLSIEIIGDGPQRAELELQAEQLGIAGGIRFRGWVSHDKLQDHLAEADVFAFPSVREFGGGAVLEAMAVGLVPVVVDYGGPGELVTDQTGFRIPIGSRSDIIANFGALLKKLCRDPGIIDAISPKAIKRAREFFTWDAKARDVLSVYNWALGKSAKPRVLVPKPDRFATDGTEIRFNEAMGTVVGS
jgi:glycosyltransferase involved in cell wall biosynthesis